MGDIQDLKKEYGWSPELERFFINTNKDILENRSGTFQIREKSNNLYWTFKFSSGKNRSVHICSVSPKNLKDGQTSFDHCCNVLLKKSRKDYISTSKLNQPIHRLIEDYVHHTESRIDINDSSIKNKVKSVRQFGRYTRENGYKINIVKNDELRQVVKKYVIYLSKRDLRGNRSGKLSRGSIKLYLQNVRYFFDWVCTKRDEGGIELFESHNFTVKYQNYLLNTFVKRPKEKHLDRKFSKQSYLNVYNDCLKVIRDTWIYYCKHGQIKEIKDSNGKVNQPQTVGTDIVFFVSFFQLRYGFRISEILHSFRNPSVYQEIGDTTGVSSFFVKQDDEWYVQIVNSKRKNRVVPITDTIFSVTPPPNGIPYTKERKPEDKYTRYFTHIVDVVMELFPSSFYTFPSPNLHTKENRPYSLNYYMNLFKTHGVNEKDWKNHGIESSHNLRSFFISYCIHDGWSPNEICSITGHTINTMYKYYVREDLKSKFDLIDKTPQSELISKMKKSIP